MDHPRLLEEARQHLKFHFDFYEEVFNDPGIAPYSMWIYKAIALLVSFVKIFGGRY
jgi:hypothetical protein